MKIAQIIPRFALAGAEVMCENLTNALIDMGHDVIVISLYDLETPITERMRSRGVRLYTCGKKSGMDLSMTRKIKKILRDFAPDVVHTHLSILKYVRPAVRGMKGVKMVHTIHNIAHKDGGKFDKIYNKRLFRRGKVIPVALSEEVRSSIVKFYGVPEASVPVVFNGLDLSKCVKKESYSRGDVFSFLHIGRFFAQKNHEMMITVFKKFHDIYPDSELLLIGDGPGREKAAEQVSSLGLGDAVKFLGLQSNVYGFLNNADAFFLPSLYEGVPMTLIEAMGTALPIVATAVGGIPDMLENEKSALLTDVDEEQLLNALKKIYESEQLREKCGRAALETSLAFSHVRTAQLYFEIYNNFG